MAQYNSGDGLVGAALTSCAAYANAGTGLIGASVTDSNATLNMGDGIDSATKSVATSVDALRAAEGNYRIFSPDEAVAEIKKYGALVMQPLCGGLPIDFAWESLETFAQDVLPRL